jgi:hypothetical protein
MDAHVWVFKATIKVNGEMMDEEIANLFNYTLKNNASNWCTTICEIIPIIDLQIWIKFSIDIIG